MTSNSSNVPTSNKMIEELEEGQAIIKWRNAEIKSLELEMTRDKLDLL